MTFAEFEQLPTIQGKRELISGRLITMPPPDNQHSLISMRILIQLLTKSGLGSGRVWADHTGYRVGGGWVEPDASISWPDQQKDEKYFLQAPMLAVEILSPDEEIQEKLTLYFKEGAQEVWVVNIRKQAMVVYHRSDAGVIREDVEAEYRSEAVGVTVSLAEIFAEV